MSFSLQPRPPSASHSSQRGTPQGGNPITSILPGEATCNRASAFSMSFSLQPQPLREHHK